MCASVQTGITTGLVYLVDPPRGAAGEPRIPRARRSHGNRGPLLAAVVLADLVIWAALIVLAWRYSPVAVLVAFVVAAGGLVAFAVAPRRLGRPLTQAPSRVRRPGGGPLEP